MTTVVRMGDRGRLVLPSDLRREMDLHPGDEFLAVVENGGLRLLPRREAAFALIGAAGPGKDRGTGSAVDELLTERRRDAALEDSELEAGQ